MGSISIISRRPPYGSVDAPEAIRHALGGVLEDIEINLILVDGGVNAARRGQDVSNTEYSSIEEGLGDCISMGANVYVEKSSLAEEGIEADDLIEGVILANGSELAGIIKESDTTMIF